MDGFKNRRRKNLFGIFQLGWGVGPPGDHIPIKKNKKKKQSWSKYTQNHLK